MLELKNISYAYPASKPILNNLEATFLPGRTYAILGASGCGKTTLLSLMGGLDAPTKGTIHFNGQPIDSKALPAFRKKHISFIFQNYNLIDYLTPEENLGLVSSLDALPVLNKVGLEKDIAKRSILKLSGGQQQRVAIARALISDSQLLLADEPTGNLDEENSAAITKLLIAQAHQANGKCVVIVTHSPEVARETDIVLKLENGTLQPVTMSKRNGDLDLEFVENEE